MKNGIVFLVTGLLFLGALSFTACNDTAKTEANTTNTTQENKGKAYTAAYICPMHCEGSGSEAPGKCPVCGMDYVANKTHSHDGHKH
jgi:predicted nucleic acid binding AN1-type Zn finger protein